MTHHLETVATAIALVMMIDSVSSAFRRADPMVDRLVEAIRQEYDQRLCAAVLAAAANLRDSHALVARYGTVKPSASASANRLVEQLYDRYGLDPSRVRRGLLCPPSPALPLRGKRHRQENPDYPQHWPNWVPAFVWAEDP